MNFKHLKQVKQNYFIHFYDAFKYSMLSLKASYYFFIHALHPDVYVTSGSETITFLKNYIDFKKKLINTKST